MSTVTATAPTYGIDNGVRHLITTQNLAELGLDWPTLQTFLASPSLKINDQSPDGISINESTFGNYSGPTASQLGWLLYMNVGQPEIEQRANIIQPPADVLSIRTYANRSGDTRTFNESIGFTVSNTFSWSLQGTAQLTFGGSATASMTAQLQKSLASSFALMDSSTHTTSNTHINHNHEDNIGTEDQSQTSDASQTQQTTTATDTITGTGSATGTGKVDAQLMLGITGSISGSLTTSWTSTSSLSGDIVGNSQVQTIATQRRQVQQYTYTLPVTTAGFVALHYPEPVPVGDTPPQDPSQEKVNVIARNVAYLNNLRPTGQPFLVKGLAETVSALEVDHAVFAADPINAANSALNIKQPRYL